MFKKILIANRGEIAVRVIRACRELGIASVAVFSEADRLSPHVRLADEARYLGPAPAAKSYLNAAALIEVACSCGAEAVHPGYGFLAENAEFARLCAEAGLVFIGPPPEAMRLLGSKTEARRVMQEAGVSVVPGTFSPLPDLEAAEREAQRLGYPVMLKAVAGGGGKGMRIVRAPQELPAALRAAASEAAAAFGDPAVYLEKCLDRPRHVEVQLLADQFGNMVHLGERECSVQRRHQKLAEESPSPAVTPALRAKMGQAALRGARAAGYSNAGTVEFLLDARGAFYFLEVNARLQVEHPVTELVTGLDLVREQIRLAAGEHLDITQAEVSLRGHAIECRIYAEDPFNQFFPSAGVVKAVREPAGPGVRVDGALEADMEVGVYYDPLLAKVITWGADRGQALDRMDRALAEYLVLGVQTTIGFHRFLMRHPGFRAGELDTGFIEREWLGSEAVEPEAARRAAILATLALHLSGERLEEHEDGRTQSRPAWREAVRGRGFWAHGRW